MHYVKDYCWTTEYLNIHMTNKISRLDKDLLYFLTEIILPAISYEFW